MEMTTMQIISLAAMLGWCFMMGFFFGNAWESGRKEREAKKEAIRRLTKEIMQENVR